jgi:hypothetical protein
VKCGWTVRSGGKAPQIKRGHTVNGEGVPFYMQAVRVRSDRGPISPLASNIIVYSLGHLKFNEISHQLEVS